MGLIFHIMSAEQCAVRTRLNNLKKLIEYSKKCKYCENGNVEVYLPDFRNHVRLEDNLLHLDIKAKTYPMSPSKKVNFNLTISINIETNDFEVIFNDFAGRPINYINNSMKTSYFSFMKNKPISLTIECRNCRNYGCLSKFLDFNYKTAKLDNESLIDFEYIKCNNELSEFSLINSYRSNQSKLRINTIVNPLGDSTNIISPDKSDVYEEITLPLIKIENRHKLLEQIELLLPFV